MKIDRAEVEAMLAACEPGSDKFLAALDRMSRRKLAELCRTWLAVEAAPVVRVGNADAYSCWLEKCQGSESGPVHSLRGQRVRLVRVGEE